MLKAVCASILLLLLAPAPSYAWGSAAHRYIMKRAIEILPPEIKPFFEHFQDELIVRVVDPDSWRSAGWEEDPNHFVDFGVPEYGQYPFAELPREYGAAIEKFGMTALRKNGLLPWREAEEFGNLRRALQGFSRPTGFPVSDVIEYAAWTSHYIQDAHMPLHAALNHDGQLTGQTGVHSRFETALFERFQSKLTINPAPPAAIRNPRDAAFDVLLSSTQLVQPLLDADKEAAAGKDTYDDDYYEKFFAKAKPMLEKRIAESITATASIIMGAWEAAGKPALKTEPPPRTPQRIRKPASDR